MSPVDIDDYRNGNGNKYRIYCNESTFSDFEDVGESQNENLGKDIAAIDRMDLASRKHPIRYVPKLDDQSDNPIYGIDHSVFMPVAAEG